MESSRNEIYSYSRVEKILYGEYIRYEHMQTMVSLEFPASTAEHVNVFIDLYDIIGRINKIAMEDEYPVEVIASGILNMIAHYKNYFWSRYQVTCDVIFVYGDTKTSNIHSEIPDYNETNEFEPCEVVNMALDRINLLIPYIPGAYIKYGYAESAVIIKNLLYHELFAPYPSIVISSSQYMYSLPGMTDRNMNEVVVFRNKYTKANGRTAYSYNEINAVNAFVAETRNIVCQVPIDPDIITLVMTLCGVPGRNIRSVKNVEQTLIMCSSMPIEIIDDIPEMYKFMTKYCQDKKWKFITEEEFTHRYLGLSLDVQLQRYQADPNSMDFSFLQKLDNPDGIRYINAKYFPRYPLKFSSV